MSQSNGKFFRYRTVGENRPHRVVVAVKRTNSGENSVYDVGFSFCSPNDERAYTKVRGRRIAEGRLEKGVSVRVTAADVEDFGGVFNAAFVEVMGLDERPHWLPQALWECRA